MTAREYDVDGLPLQIGDTGAGVADLHVRLYRGGLLAELPEQIDDFGPVTQTAVRGFQTQRKLRSDGICNQATWDALVESDYQLGDRLIYLQKPMMRGDDVEELQRTLGIMGFNAGRVDGIFGPDTQAALADFQRNVAITVDGIAGHETLASLQRIRSHVGSHTVAAVRENERLRSTPVAMDTCRLVIGDLSGQRALAEMTARILRQRGVSVALLEQPDGSEQARAANDFGAHVYIGLELADTALCHLAYFAVDNFESAGGKHLCSLLHTELEQVFVHHESVASGSDALVSQSTHTIEIEGLRLPPLRETRMPAVVIEVGPSQALVEARPLWAAGIANAVEVWLTAPLEPLERGASTSSGKTL